MSCLECTWWESCWRRRRKWWRRRRKSLCQCRWYCRTRGPRSSAVDTSTPTWTAASPTPPSSKAALWRWWCSLTDHDELCSRLFLHFPVVPYQTRPPMSWFDPENWTPCWVPREVPRRWILFATSITPQPIWACASSRTLTMTGSACTYSDTCRQAQMVPIHWSRISSPCMFDRVLTGNAIYLKLSLTCHFQRQMPDIPMRYIHFDVSKKESYSLDSVGKHGFGMFVCFCFYCNTRLSSIWIKDNVWYFSSKIHFLQLWRSAPNHTVWWGPTSIQQWNLVCSTCSTGSVSSTQVQLSTGYQLNILVLLHDFKTSQLLQSLCIFLTIFCLVFSPSLLALLLFSGTIFEGGFVDVFTMVKHIDYPRDRETHNITAAIHPQLQVQSETYLLFVWFKQRLKKHSDLLIK